MLTRILEWSLRHRHLVLLGWGALLIAGVISALRLPIDAFPDTTPVQVQVNATAPALSPLEIERQITRPVEWAIAGLPQLHEVRTVSKFGFSQVTVTFEDGTDIYLARQVELGADDGATVDVTKGLRGGEAIVAQGAFLLKSELLKGSLKGDDD